MSQEELAMVGANQPRMLRDENGAMLLDMNMLNNCKQPDRKQRKEKLEQRFKLQKLLCTALSDIVLLNEQSVQELQEAAQLTPENSQELQEPGQSTPENSMKMKEKLEKLQELLIQPEWTALEALVTETKDWDAVSTIPYEKSFLCHTRLQKVVGSLLANTAISFEFLKLIIEHFKADNERIEPNLDAPIHYAVHQLNGEFLDWLLSDRKSFVNVNSRNSRKETALAILCSSYDKCMKGIIKPKKKQLMNNKDLKPKMTNDQRMEMLNTIRLLIKKLVDAGADFNICSQQLKLPFELLQKHSKYDEPTKSLVDWCAQKAGRALVIRGITRTKECVLEFYNNESPVKVTEELLEICLSFNDRENFEKYLLRFKLTKENVKKVIEVVLQTAIKKKMSECVRKIVDLFGVLIFQVDQPIRKDEDSRTSSSWELVHRVELKGLLKKACLVADLPIVKKLTCLSRITNSLVLNDDPVLALTLTKAYAAKNRPKDQEALLAVAEYLAIQPNIYISKLDNSGNTPLHLALKYNFHDVATTLLKHRYAYIGLRNRDNLTLLDYGGYEFWKKYFDSCIEIDSERISKDKNILRLNLNCLKPLKKKRKIYSDVSTEASSQKKESCTQVCVNWLKCNSCKKSAGGHSRAAAGAAAQEKDNWWSIVQKASQVKQQPNHYARVQTEMSIIRQIAESKDLKRLLLHPIIYTFIMIRWIRLNSWMYLNVLLISANMVVFGWHSLNACSVDYNPAPSLKIFAIIGTIIMMIRELLQFVILRKSYFTLGNLMDIVNIFVMILVLLKGCIGLLSSLLMISFAMHFALLLGSLPFNILSTTMYMFKTVSQNFAQSFLLFLPLIGSFIFGFYHTYNDKSGREDGPGSLNNNDTSQSDTCSSNADNFNTFSTFWNATIKTLVMTTGEFDASSIDINGDKLILFLLFLFFAPIVILNLINGLAVSDIAAIRAESELISISKKVMLLELYERNIVTKGFFWLDDYFSISFFRMYGSSIEVRMDQFRKILVKELKREGKLITTTSTFHMMKQHPQSTQKPHPERSSKWVSLSAYYPFFHNGTDAVIKMPGLKMKPITTFLTLDRAIMEEALAVIQRRPQIV